MTTFRGHEAREGQAACDVAPAEARRRGPRSRTPPADGRGRRREFGPRGRIGRLPIGSHAWKNRRRARGGRHGRSGDLPRFPTCSRDLPGLPRSPNQAPGTFDLQRPVQPPSHAMADAHGARHLVPARTTSNPERTRRPVGLAVRGPSWRDELLDESPLIAADDNDLSGSNR
jgi:hypothetical protein